MAAHKVKKRVAHPCQGQGYSPFGAVRRVLKINVDIIFPSCYYTL